MLAKRSTATTDPTAAKTNRQSTWNSEKWKSPPSCLTKASQLINSVCEIDLLKQIEILDLKRRCKRVLFLLRAISVKLVSKMQWVWIFRPRKLRGRVFTDRRAISIQICISISVSKLINIWREKEHLLEKLEVFKWKKFKTSVRKTGLKVSFSKEPCEKRQSEEAWSTQVTRTSVMIKPLPITSVMTILLSNLHTLIRIWRKIPRIQTLTFIRLKKRMPIVLWLSSETFIHKDEHNKWPRAKWSLPRNFSRMKIMIIGKRIISSKIYINTQNTP